MQLKRESISREVLERLYRQQKLSMAEIARQLHCSVHKVQYWMTAHSIHSRSRADAMYQWHNPDGDPFTFRLPRNAVEERLFGIGIGLYWGEGTRANKVSVRLGNTDPHLIRVFIKFLCTFFSISKSDMRFGLQLFNDIEPGVALDFWAKILRIKGRQFLKPVITKSVSRGTYKKKAPYGVVTVYYHNRKLRDILMQLVADVAQR